MKRPSAGLLVTISLGAVSAASGCSHYRPALFADRPVVEAMRDDEPIAVPAQRSYDERQQVADIYLRRPLFDVVRPLDFQTGGDVNAMDEVPISSWYDPGQTTKVAAPDAAQTPPVLPLTALDESPSTTGEALVVRDARGVRYELLADRPDHVGLLTGAEVLGSHLVRGLGLHAPKAWIVGVPDVALLDDGPAANARLERWFVDKAPAVSGRRRLSATLWPSGLDVGYTKDFSTRDDDKNDTVEHQNRRTLRATRIFAHWMGWTNFSVLSTRDLYVGAKGVGHLLHFLVGTSQSLGTQDIQEKERKEDLGGGIGRNLMTLGLAAPTVTAARRSPFASVGYLPPIIEPGTFNVSPPYSPFIRLTPPDEYWAAKRMIDAGDDALRIGIEAALLPPDAARYLTGVLQFRRRILVAHALAGVTPIDVAATTGRAVWLRDRSIAAGFTEAENTKYEVRYLDPDGVDVAPRRTLQARGELSVVGLPNSFVFGPVVIQVRAIRNGVVAPRAVDIHVRADRQSARVIGVRH